MKSKKAAAENSDSISKQETGDWGEICNEDKQENELSLREGFRLLSSYRTNQSVKFWRIAEHKRSAATLLLPEEY